MTRTVLKGEDIGEGRECHWLPCNGPVPVITKIGKCVCEVEAIKGVTRARFFLIDDDGKETLLLEFYR